MASPASYPIPSGVLRPAWRNPVSRALAGASLAAMAAALALRWPIRVVEIDDVALHVVLPALLAFVLAFAPNPGTRVGRLARVLTVLGLAASTFIPSWQPVLLACFPLVLTIAVVVGRSTWDGVET